MKEKKYYKIYFKSAAIIFLLIFFFPIYSLAAEKGEDTKQKEWEQELLLYQEYQDRLEQIENDADINACGFQIINDQIFPITLENFGDVYFIPAMDKQYHRLVLFLAKGDGTILYKSDQLETNNRNSGMLKQPNRGIAAVSFQDVNGDDRIDIILITSCINETGTMAGKTYKVGDVLFQNEQGFYRDWRLSDKINRFTMNKSIEFITAFVRDGYSTEFLYTAATLNELLENGFQIITEQCYWRKFEKLGKLQLVPGTYSMSDYQIFMIYLVNEQGYIVWSFQPMGDYDNLYALKGITCRDIDGDGLKDVAILARYSYEGSEGQLIIKSDYSIYYQRTSGFSVEIDYKNQYQCNDNDTLSELVERARSYWGWGTTTNDKSAKEELSE